MRNMWFPTEIKSCTDNAQSSGSSKVKIELLYPTIQRIKFNIYFPILKYAMGYLILRKTILLVINYKSYFYRWSFEAWRLVKICKNPKTGQLQHFYLQFLQQAIPIQGTYKRPRGEYSFSTRICVHLRFVRFSTQVQDCTEESHCQCSSKN